MVKVAGRDATGAVARGVKGMALPLLPAIAWADIARIWSVIRPAADTAGRAVGLALKASRENIIMAVDGGDWELA